jgi:hypothetical protein
MIPRPCFQALHTVYLLFCYLFACCYFYSRLHLLLIIIYTTCISPSLCRTSAPIHLASVLGVLGTQETFCIVIAGLFERDSFDLFLPEFDKPWVTHLRETCCCSTNLCTWRPNTVYKNRSMCRHHTTKALDRRIILFACTVSSGSALFTIYAKYGCIQVSSIIMTSSGSVVPLLPAPEPVAWC